MCSCISINDKNVHNKIMKVKFKRFENKGIHLEKNSIVLILQNKGPESKFILINIKTAMGFNLYYLK